MTTPDFSPHRRIAEGKTKILYKTDEEYLLVFSKDDITAGDGAKHEILPGKGALSTRTTANVFDLLGKTGIPTAFVRRHSDPRAFVARHCSMLLIESVCRREAHGSFVKRAPFVPKSHRFNRLVWEPFLKTSGKQFAGHDLEKDDPLMRITRDEIELYRPDTPFHGSRPFLVLSKKDNPAVKEFCHHLPEMERITRIVFLVLEQAWAIQGRRLVDFKIEFGLTKDGRLVVADVIDSDSWRLLEPGGGYGDKQAFREGALLEVVGRKFETAAAQSDNFEVPKQQIVLWSTARADKEEAVERVFKPHLHFVPVRTLWSSLDRGYERRLQEVRRHASEIRDTVVVLNLGLGDTWGPRLAMDLPCPVITTSIPSSAESHAASSCLFATSVENAMRGALEILATRNPAIYAPLRYEKEETLDNMIPLEAFRGE